MASRNIRLLYFPSSVLSLTLVCMIWWRFGTSQSSPRAQNSGKLLLDALCNILNGIMKVCIIEFHVLLSCKTVLLEHTCLFQRQYFSSDMICGTLQQPAEKKKLLQWWHDTPSTQDSYEDCEWCCWSLPPLTIFPPSRPPSTWAPAKTSHHPANAHNSDTLIVDRGGLCWRQLCMSSPAEVTGALCNVCQRWIT